MYDIINAATLVTAAFYIILRSSHIIEYAFTTLIVITWVGAITSLFVASTGLIKNDINRVIAYSTCTQLGYLCRACGLSQYESAILHLVNHHCFKSSTILCCLLCTSWCIWSTRYT